MARERFSILPYGDGGGATIAHGTDPANKPEYHTIGETAYILVCDFLRDVIDGTGYGQIETREIDRAWSDGVAAVIAEIARMESSELLAGTIHQAWYQGMLMQGRGVPIARRQWETLPDADRGLDRHIARVLLQQMAINLDNEVRVRREITRGANLTTGDDLRQSTGDDTRDFLTRRGEYAPRNTNDPFTDNFTPHQWQQLVNDARRERDDAEVRHAKSEELRRADNATWAAERALWDSGKRKIDTILDGQAREIAAMKDALAACHQVRKSLDAEIVKLNGQLQLMRDIANAEIAKRDTLPFDFAAEMLQAPRIGGAFMGVAAIGAELASVRMMVNNRQQREIDPVGFGKRLATIAGYALQLYREDRKGDPTVANATDTR